MIYISGMHSEIKCPLQWTRSLYKWKAFYKDNTVFATRQKCNVNRYLVVLKQTKMKTNYEQELWTSSSNITKETKFSVILCIQYSAY